MCGSSYRGMHAKYHLSHLSQELHKIQLTAFLKKSLEGENMENSTKFLYKNTVFLSVWCTFKETKFHMMTRERKYSDEWIKRKHKNKWHWFYACYLLCYFWSAYVTESSTLAFHTCFYVLFKQPYYKIFEWKVFYEGWTKKYINSALVEVN